MMDLLTMAMTAQILGNAEHHWIFTDSVVPRAFTTFTQQNVSDAVAGSSRLLARGTGLDATSWLAMKAAWSTQNVDNYNPYLPNNIHAQLDSAFFTRTQASTFDATSDVSPFVFDAVALAGIAACKAAPATDGETLLKFIKNTMMCGCLKYVI